MRLGKINRTASPTGSTVCNKARAVAATSNEGGTETYYAWVEAADPIQAVAQAQREAVAANDCVESEQQDFAPLLVIQGHHYGQPLSDQ
jgi:hypothetical protein